MSPTIPESQLQQYPLGPGHKARDTSAAAALSVAGHAATLRDDCLNILRETPSGLTADEVAEKRGRSILSIRPRVAELARLGKITDSGERRSNVSGRPAIVWRAVGAS